MLPSASGCSSGGRLAMPTSPGMVKQPVQARLVCFVPALGVDDQGGPAGDDPRDPIAKGEDQSEYRVAVKKTEVCVNIETPIRAALGTK
jgi:hypothetical protein